MNPGRDHIATSHSEIEIASQIGPLNCTDWFAELDFRIGSDISE
jgi:hypothetical protein